MRRRRKINKIKENIAIFLNGEMKTTPIKYYFSLSAITVEEFFQVFSRDTKSKS
jgi:hypothetical protein